MDPRMRLRLVGFGTAVAFGLLGCGSGTGPEGTGYVLVSLSGAASGAASAATGLGSPAFDVVPVESIASMNVGVTAVEIHLVGAEEQASGGEAEGSGEGGDTGAEDGGPWIRIDLTMAGEEEVDMASLPEADAVASGFQIAVEAVPAGTYNLLRLFFDGVSAARDSRAQRGSDRHSRPDRVVRGARGRHGRHSRHVRCRKLPEERGLEHQWDLRNAGDDGRGSGYSDAAGGLIVDNGEGRGGLLDAGYDGLKLELEATEQDITKLQVRADKLRTALAALQDLLPGRSPAPTNGAASDGVWVKHGPAVQ